MTHIGRALLDHPDLCMRLVDLANDETMDLDVSPDGRITAGPRVRQAIAELRAELDRRRVPTYRRT